MADCVDKVYGIPLFLDRILGVEEVIKRNARQKAKVCVDQVNAEVVQKGSGQIYRALENEDGSFVVAPILGCAVDPSVSSYVVRGNTEAKTCWDVLTKIYSDKPMRSIAHWHPIDYYIVSQRIEID